MPKLISPLGGASQLSGRRLRISSLEGYVCLWCRCPQTPVETSSTVQIANNVRVTPVVLNRAPAYLRSNPSWDRRRHTRRHRCHMCSLRPRSRKRSLE